MRSKGEHDGCNAELRLQAEAALLERPAPRRGSSDALSDEETQKVLHELRVQRIELEIQNEELRITQVKLAAAHERYFDLYDLAPVGYFSVGDKGLILQANLLATTLLGGTRIDPFVRFAKEFLKRPAFGVATSIGKQPAGRHRRILFAQSCIAQLTFETLSK